MNRAEKAEFIEELKKDFSEAGAVFVTDYRGLRVDDLTELRKELRKSKTSFRVIKNRLALRALEEGLAKEMAPHFDNTTAIAVSKGDIAASAKALTGFAKTHDQLKIKAGILEGKLISEGQVKELSNLPSRDQLLGQLLSVWNQVPTGFVRVLNAIPNGWVNVLNSFKIKKESGD